MNGLVPGIDAWRYEVSAGIRPPRKSGKVRGVAYELEPGGGMEIWHCDHDHAPGVHSCQLLTDEQRSAAQECAAGWLAAQMDGGFQPRLPVARQQ